MNHPTQETYIPWPLVYSSHGVLVGMRNSLMGPPLRIDPTNEHSPSDLQCISQMLFLLLSHTDFLVHKANIEWHTITDLHDFNALNIDYK